MNELTTKQEKFVQNIVSGMTQRQAYKEAFQVDYDENAIDSNASTLFNSTKIQQRYRELMEKLQDDAIMTAKERMVWLSEVVKGIQMEDRTEWADGESYTYQRAADLNTKIKALDTLNKMSGEYTTKLEHSGAIPVVIDDDIRE